jgi:hypothetical protein
VVAETDAGLFGRLHPEHMLCGGDVLPSGEALDHPYPTLGNVLLRSLAEAVPRLLPNGERGDPAPRFLGAGAEIGAAIWQHCVTHIDGEQVFASSVDLLGNATVYDDPEFSLALLPFLGFCDPEDPVWTATMEFLRSTALPAVARRQGARAGGPRAGQPATAGRAHRRHARRGSRRTAPPAAHRPARRRGRRARMMPRRARQTSRTTQRWPGSSPGRWCAWPSPGPSAARSAERRDPGAAESGCAKNVGPACASR